MAKKTKANQDKERFRSNLLAVVSHELNTPLTGIFSALTVLEERFAAEKEFVPMLRRNAERLKKTIDNLMELSRADAGALRVRLAEVDMENLLRVSAESLKKNLKKQKFTMDFEIEEDLPRACADPRRLSFAFECLVNNAMKFSDLTRTKEIPAVKVSLNLDTADKIPQGLLKNGAPKTKMYLYVSVQSSLPSVGEAPDSFEQLFEPFGPWRDVDSMEREGLGVELALAKEIFHAHEGFIWAEFPEEGSHDAWIFHFALPVLSRIDEIELVVNNRLHTGIGLLGKLSLLLLRAGPGQEISQELRPKILKEVQTALFRASDSAFWMEDTGELLILLDDCDALAAERVAARVLELLAPHFIGLELLWTTVTGPEDGTNAKELLEKARFSWRPTSH